MRSLRVLSQLLIKKGTYIMTRKVFTLLLAASLATASITPVLADDCIIEAQQDSETQEDLEPQNIITDESEYYEEISAVEDGSAADGYNEDYVQDDYDEDFYEEEEYLVGNDDSDIEEIEEAVEEDLGLAGDTQEIPIDEAHFPDPVFRNYVQEEFDNGDGYLSVEEREGVTSVEVSKKKISSLAGIEYFEKLQVLDCARNELASLDVSKCTALTVLDCSENQLPSLDVSKCTALMKFYCDKNQLTSLDVSGCTALTVLYCSENQLPSLDVSKCTALMEFYCYNNQLPSLDVSKCTKLMKYYCGKNQLPSLDVSKCTLLMDFDCNSNKLTSLDVSGCTALTELRCDSNGLTRLDVSGCTALTELWCDSNKKLTSLDVSGCTALTEIWCYSNELTSLDVSGCTVLKWLRCDSNKLTSLDMSGCTALNELDCYGNQLTKLDISDNPKILKTYFKGDKKVKDFTMYSIDTDDFYGRLTVDNTTEIIAEHEHIPQITSPEKAATCTAAGNTPEVKCSVCGEILKAQTTKPALGHSPWTWTVTKPATTTSEGIETRTCSRCQAKETRPIPKLAKKANTLSVKAKKPSLKASKLKKKKQTIKASKAFTIKGAQGTVSYKKKSGSSKKLSINAKTGMITVKKGTKKGTYKIVVAVTAAGNEQYEARTKKVTVKVKVK